MQRRLALLIVGCVVAFGCADDSSSSVPRESVATGPPVSEVPATDAVVVDDGPWAGAPSAELEPTGMVLTDAAVSDAGPGDAVAIDGAGNVWTTGPWNLTRVAPDGHATTWDAQDDIAFATTWDIAPSNGSGVWLKDQQTVRLFDGTRFVAVLTPPPELAQVLDGPDVFVVTRDVAEVGDGTVWLSVENSSNAGGVAPLSAGRILSYSDGDWSTVADVAGMYASDLVVDADGVPWAAMLTTGNDPASRMAQRWSGTEFVAPAADDPAYPSSFGALAAAPDGGVYTFSYGQAGPTVSRFDGTSWSIVAAGASEHMADSWGGRPLAADANGAWVATSAGVAHVTPAGQWGDISIPAASDPAAPQPQVATRGDMVAARTASGLEVLGPEAFTVLWTDPVTTRVSGGLLAVSADEVWRGASRYRDGSWTTPVEAGPNEWTAGVLASDGAVWFVTPDGVVRVAGDDVETVAADITQGSMTAGPEGSVWVTVDGDAVRLEPDGTRTSIGHPSRREAGCLYAGGSDGSLWSDVRCGSSPVPRLFRWDGATWTHVELPGPGLWMFFMVASSDDSVWATFTGEDPSDPASGVARYTGDGWQTYPGWPYSLSAAPGGKACSLDDPDDTTVLHCYDADGLTDTIAVPVNADVSVAPDGTIWVSGEQVARIPETVPAT